jgi:hypothetical protein
MRIRAVASVLVSSSQPIRAAASFLSAVVAASSVSIVAHATVVQPIRAEVYIPEILPLASANTVVTDRINSFAVNKVVVDVVEATETMAFSVGLVLEDSVTMADSATKTFTEVIDFDRTDADVDPDPVTVTDVRTASVGKVLTDSATATDVATRTVGKTATDAVTATDTNAKDVGKSVSDSASLTDSAAFDVVRVSTDTVTASDADAKTVGKVVNDPADGVTASDAAALNIQPAYSDSVTASDVVVQSVGKTLTDSATPSDAAPVFAVTKVLTDSVTMTDSVYKDFSEMVDYDRNDADVDPDPVTATDVLSTSVAKVLTDSATASDAAPVFSVGSVLTDSATASDAAPVFSVGSVLTDSATASDAAALSPGKVLADSVTASDAAPVFAQNKTLSDSATPSDAAPIFVIGAVLADSATATDTISLSLTLGQSNPIYDFAFPSDDKFTYFPVPGTLNGHLIHQPTVNGEFVLTTDPNAGIVYAIRTESASYMFGGYGLNATTLN